jgi:hypothetical protein
MAGITEQRAAFGQADTLLRGTAAASARALQVHRGTPAGDALERHLEHTLDRLALLYGRGTYENLTTTDILETAVDNELRLAAELDGPAAEAAAGRAQALVDAARRGVRLHVRQPPASAETHRGVYVQPLRPELERSLWARHEPYLRWRDGAVLIVTEDQAAMLRTAGDEVAVLFLDADELLDLDARDDRPALEAELERRLAAARSTPDGVGDSRDRYALRILHGQSVVLRNLRDRLADGHPAAHAALLPVIASHRAHLEVRMAAGPATREVTANPLGASIDHEQDLQALLGEWTVEPEDPSGLRDRFRAVADADTELAELRRHDTR